MATITDDHIASVSLEDADSDPDGFAQKLGKSFEEYGFAIIADHGIPDELIQRAEEKAKAFFALPEDVKRKYLIPGGGSARGYTPSEIPHFKNTFQELFATFDAAGLKVLKAIARYLKIDENYFEDAVRDGNSVLRALHYPPQNEPTGEHIRAGAHEDINAITLLLGAEEAGLELLTRDGRWIPVSPKPGELVINIGDMLQRLTNGKLRSTTHRVVNPTPDRASKARYSMPFFLHFRSDFLIEALPGTVPAGAQATWPPITANDYLQERLREIKLV